MHTLCRIQELFDVHLINNVVCEMRNWSQVRVSAVKIFDRVVKLRHKERSQYNCKNGVSDVEPPIVGGVTSHLLDRLNDTTRTFPRALILGNYPDSVLRRLGEYPVGVKEVLFLDPSPSIRHQIQNEVYPGLEVQAIDGDDEDVSIEESTIDLVVHNLGLHWVNDLQSCLKKLRGVLKPDGLFLATMIGGVTLPELRQSLSFAEQERRGGVSPRMSPLVSVSDAGRLLTDAGFKLTSVDVDNIVMKYKNAFDLIQDLRLMGESNACIQRQNSLDLDTALAMSAIYGHRFKDDESWISASIQVIYMIGWSPAPGQQQPAARGSAEVSLEDLDSMMDLDFKEISPDGTEEK